MPINDQQLTNKQHAVPQNIMDVEFKIIGDLTMRQFLYLFICGITSYGLYEWVNSPVKWLIILFLVLFGIALAFVPVQERGLDQWIINFFSAIYSPTQLIWKKVPVLPAPFTYQGLSMVRKELITLAPTTSRRRLEEYLEEHGDKQEVDPLDFDETIYIGKVREAFQFENTQKTAVDTIEIEVEEPTQTTTPPTQQQPQPQPQPEQTQQEPQTSIQPQQEIQKKDQPQSQQQDDEQTTQLQVKPKPKPKPKPKAHLPKRGPVSISQMTPDRVSGRVFTNFLPSSGEIVLPIRGEKVIKTTSEIEVEEDINEKAKQLETLLDQIKSDEKYKDVIQKVEQTKPKAQDNGNIINYSTDLSKKLEHEINEQAAKVAESIKEENKSISTKINELQKQMEQQNDKEKQKTLDQIKRLQEEKEKALKDYEQVKSKVSELEQKLSEKEKVKSTDRDEKREIDLSVKLPKITKPSFGKTIPLASTSNIISGIVKDNNDKPIEGILVIIKNEKNEPVRAIKTNVMGQFYITTPVTNGKYKVEINKENDTGLSFDIINVEAAGELIPPVEFKGKK